MDFLRNTMQFRANMTNNDRPFLLLLLSRKGPSWTWSYGSSIYNYLWYQCLSPLMLWVRISIKARYTTLCDKVSQWRCFSSGPPVSSTNKTDHHDIAELLLKGALNAMKQTQTILSQLEDYIRGCSIYRWICMKMSLGILLFKFIMFLFFVSKCYL